MMINLQLKGNCLSLNWQLRLKKSKNVADMFDKIYYLLTIENINFTNQSMNLYCKNKC